MQGESVWHQTSYHQEWRNPPFFLKGNDMSQILNTPPNSIKYISEKSSTQNIYHPFSQLEHNSLESFPKI